MSNKWVMMDRSTTGNEGNGELYITGDMAENDKWGNVVERHFIVMSLSACDRAVQSRSENVGKNHSFPFPSSPWSQFVKMASLLERINGNAATGPIRARNSTGSSRSSTPYVRRPLAKSNFRGSFVFPRIDQTATQRATSTHRGRMTCLNPTIPFLHDST